MTNTSKHTPEPWVVNANNDITSARGLIAWLPTNEAQKLNAHLIAAAPAMYGALKAALDYYRGVFTGNTVTDKMMSSRLEHALAQAEGR